MLRLSAFTAARGFRSLAGRRGGGTQANWNPDVKTPSGVLVDNSLLVESAHPISHALRGLGRPPRAQDLIALTSQLVIVDKKFFQLSHECLAQVLEMMNVREAVIGLFNCHDAIISLPILFLPLFTFDDSNDPALQWAARKCRFVHQYQHIPGVAVVYQRGWHKAKIVGEFHPRRKDFLEYKDSLFLVECVLVATALRSFDHLPTDCSRQDRERHGKVYPLPLLVSSGRWPTVPLVRAPEHRDSMVRGVIRPGKGTAAE